VLFNSESEIENYLVFLSRPQNSGAKNTMVHMKADVGELHVCFTSKIEKISN
jgi:hypothetical protein